MNGQSILLSLFFFFLKDANSSTGGKLAIILLDGFRHDYVDLFDKGELPNFHKIISEGVRAKYVQTIFPSLSKPSWATIATGKDCVCRDY